ncbi:DUF2972 domain-containing protein, partial [Helicobacter bilis]|uniref:DUF2972 domain-containing protein n=1 Tax=Helicobacter bilis TaxID=37372 RepID=UPI002943DAE2
CINGYSPQTSNHLSPTPNINSIQHNIDMGTVINPYPPLLNPKTIDYKHIGAEMAWELNLPLPSNYKFVWVCNGGSGSEAFMSFLEHCGVNLEPFWYHAKEKYMLDFNMLVSKPNQYNILCIYNRYIEHTKYIHLTQKRDFIYIAGDVISRLKSGLNHLDNDTMADIITHAMRNPTPNTPKEKMFPDLRYYYKDSQGLPNTKCLNTHMLHSYTGFYDFFSYVKPYIKNLYILSTNDLNAENAFKTFQRLYEIFCLPKAPTDEKLFTQRANMFRGGLYVLPISLRIQLIDVLATIEIMPYRFSLNLPFKESKINISQEIFTKEVVIDSMEIVFMINKDEFAKLMEDYETYEKVRLYIAEYIDMLEVSVEHNKSQLVSETDILLYLQKTGHHREQLQELMKMEAEYFKTYCRDIFSLWKYYQEFEEICIKE